MDIAIKHFDDLKLTELYEILRVRNEVFVVEQECIYNDCDYKDKNSYHLFLKDNNEIIAYLRILNKKVSYEEIAVGRVLVIKNHRNKGLARKIMLEAMSYIENQLNEKKIRISAQSYLVPFYESLEFKKVSEEYLEDNIPHVEMLYLKKEKL